MPLHGDLEYRDAWKLPVQLKMSKSSGGSRGVSEVSGNWSAFPSGQTTNDTVKGSLRGHSYRHAHEQNKSCARIRARACDDLYHGYHVLSYKTDKVEVKQLIMEQRYNIVPGIIITENCATVNKEKNVCS